MMSVLILTLTYTYFFTFSGKYCFHQHLIRHPATEHRGSILDGRQRMLGACKDFA